MTAILQRFPALVVALIVGCDGGAPVEPTRPVHLTSVDTLRPGQIGRVRGSGLTHLRSLLLDGVAATELVARSDSVAEFRVPSLRACETDMRAVKGSAPIGAVVLVCRARFPRVSPAAPAAASAANAPSRPQTAATRRCT